jgi:hypothetical protein
VHYRWIVSAWRNADFQFRARREHARARLAVLDASRSIVRANKLEPLR